MPRALLALTPLSLALVLATGCDSGKDAEPAKAEAARAETLPPATAPAGPPMAHDGSMPGGHPPMPAGHPPVAAASPGGAEVKALGGPRDITPSGEQRDVTIADLTAKVPKEWEDMPPRSQMRLAEMVLPGPGGDVSMAVFRFPGGGGSLDANLERWKGQLTPGAETPEAKTETIERDGLTITTLDAQGKFSAPAMPGAPASPDIERARLLGIIVEGKGDAFYFKAVGDAKTMDLWAGEPMEGFVNSIAVK